MTTKPVAEIVAELLPCPFCGSQPLEDFIEGHKHVTFLAQHMPDFPGAHIIECVQCEYRMFAETSVMVKAKWNHRQQSAELTRLTEENEPPICGTNSVLPARIIGCGNRIRSWDLVYRCTHCDTPFHKHCAETHFKNDNVLTQEHIDSMTNEELARINIPSKP